MIERVKDEYIDEYSKESVELEDKRALDTRVRR